MTNEQIVAIVAPMAFNAAIIGLLVLWMKAKFENIDEKFKGVDEKFNGVNEKFKGVNQRFDDMRAMWLSELTESKESWTPG